jgi:hypothetical protein
VHTTPIPEMACTINKNVAILDGILGKNRRNVLRKQNSIHTKVL